MKRLPIRSARFLVPVFLSLLAACAGPHAPSAAQQERAARLFNVGVGLMAESKFAEAQSRFDSARALVPNEACYALAAGQARMNQANYDTARMLFAQAVALDSTLREAWYASAFLALREGRNEDALAALAHCSDDPASQYLTGTAYGRLDSMEDAAAHFHRSIELDPQFISAHYALAQLYQRTGQDSLAQPLLERFGYLKDNGGTSIDLGGDIGSQKQGRLAESAVPGWRRTPFADERTTRMRIRRATAIWPPEEGDMPRAWVAARIIDLDCDGRPDLVLAAEDGVRLWRNEGAQGGGVKFADITERAGLPKRFTTGGGVTGVALGDFNRDCRSDLVITQWGESSLWRQSDTTEVRFERAPIALPGARMATWADIDHDSYLDLVLVPLAAHHGPGPMFGLSLWHNRGDGTFADGTEAAGVSEAHLAPHLEGRGGIVSVRCADRDRDWDSDLLLCFAQGPPMWLDNQHDGRFLLADGKPDLLSLALPAHLGPDSAHALATNAAIGDFVPNGWLDILTGGATGMSTVATTGPESHLPSDTFPAQGLSDGSDWQVRLTDLDLDGDLDIVAFLHGGAGAGAKETVHRVRVLGNDGTGIHWTDQTAELPDMHWLAQGVPLADIEVGALGDEARTVILLLPCTGPPELMEVQPEGRAARILLVGGRSTREGFGALVDIAQGYHWQRRLVAEGGSGQSGNELLVGLGRGGPIDMIRVTWASGIRQSVLHPLADSLITIVEKPGETSSCPFVYAWNGERFEFIADALGGGVIGVVVDPPDTYHQPDPDEYVLVRGDQLRAQDGALKVRVAEVLGEASIIDRVRLLAVAHPPHAEIYPAEVMPMSTAPPAFAIHRVTNARPIARAWDDAGHDVSELLREKDRRYVSPGRRLPYVGYGIPHTLTLDLGPLPQGRPVVLVWDGWTSFWNSTSIAEAAHDGVRMMPPRLEIPDGRGGWRTIIPDVGVPAGKPKTIFTDLTGTLPPGVHTVRLATNMLVFWDRVRVTTDPLDREPVEVAELPLREARLRPLGYPRPTTPDGSEPYAYDYQDLSHIPPWPTLSGRYTRYGPVLPLLEAVDDMFVVMNHGDEIALEFPEPPPAPEGWSRDYLIYLNGYMKETVLQDPLLSKLDPLPYRAMPGYPYQPPAAYPDGPEYRTYLRDYNTRVLGAP